MNINNGVVIGRESVMPIKDIVNMNIDYYGLTVICVAVVIIYFITQKGYELLQLKTKFDCNIDSRIDCKIMPIKDDIKLLKEEQSITRSDIEDIKVNVAKMSTSLEFIADMFRQQCFLHTERENVRKSEGNR